MSSKVMTISPPKYALCQLQEVKVLRSRDFVNDKNNMASSCQKPVEEIDKEVIKQSLSDIGVNLRDTKLIERQREKATDIF